MTRETCADQALAALASAVEEVLETMFFTTVDGLVDRMPDAADAELVSAALPFCGELSGIFHLNLSLASARRMAAAFLAAEPESLSPDRVGEVVCELANMICGCTLSRLRAEHTFELLTPHLESGREAPAAPSFSPVFQLEDGFLAVTLQVQ